jgi:hypothetical protein
MRAAKPAVVGSAHTSDCKKVWKSLFNVATSAGSNAGSNTEVIVFSTCTQLSQRLMQKKAATGLGNHSTVR